MENKEPLLVIENAERKWSYPWRGVRLYNLYRVGGEEIVYNLWEDFPDLFNLEVHYTKKQEADRLSLQLFSLGPHPNPLEARKIVDKLLKICDAPYGKKTDLEKWAHTAVQMPGDIGGPRKKVVKNIITSRARGKVLETMCGFNSYFGESEKISEVIALDFCREMLERYAYPERKRILFDLERINNGEKLFFFNNCEFDTIGCWGSNYLTSPVPVFAEFHRIMQKLGKFLVLESTSEGYSDQVKRYFNPQECASFMGQAGFIPKIIPLPGLKTEREFGDYFLVEGVKN